MGTGSPVLGGGGRGISWFCGERAVFGVVVLVLDLHRGDGVLGIGWGSLTVQFGDAHCQESRFLLLLFQVHFHAILIKCLRSN